MSFLTSPVFILLAAMVIFLLCVWAALPFAVYGVRRRLDLLIENLDQIQVVLDRALANGRSSQPRHEEQNGDNRAARRLLVTLRKEMLQFAPALQERVLDSENVVVFCRNEKGMELPCMVISLSENGVLISLPLASIGEAFSGFSPDQFRDYATSFLPEKYGFFASASPDGKELHVNIEARESNPLDLFVGIVREQLYDPIQGGAR